MSCSHRHSCSAYMYKDALHHKKTVFAGAPRLLSEALEYFLPSFQKLGKKSSQNKHDWLAWCASGKQFVVLPGTSDVTDSKKNKRFWSCIPETHWCTDAPQLSEQLLWKVEKKKKKDCCVVFVVLVTYNSSAGVSGGCNSRNRNNKSARLKVLKAVYIILVKFI